MNDPFKKQREETARELIAKTEAELARAERLPATSRDWTDPNGYQYLGVWQNAALLRVLIRQFTNTLPLKPTLNGKPLEYRLKAQLDDAARSVKRNIEEGFKRDNTESYIKFISYSQGSLAEVKGDIYDCKVDGFLPSRPGSTLLSLGFDLNVFKGPSKGGVKGEPSEPGHPYYQPLKTLNPKSLTYEIFIELINKTDYLLRRLVISLEAKDRQDKARL